MVEPYQAGMFKKVRYAKKTVVKGEFVVVLVGAIEDRGMVLIPEGSRAVRRGEIFELMCSADEGIQPGGGVDNVTLLGFVEVTQPGVIRFGDAVSINGQAYGRVAGFDYTHFPNHQNVVLRVRPEQLPPPEVDLGHEATFILDED